MTKVNMELFTNKGFDEAKEIRSRIIRGETSMDDLDDNSRQRVILLYRHAFINAGADLLKNESALVNNKKEDMKITLAGKVESCRNRIKEIEDEMAAMLKNDGQDAEVAALKQKLVQMEAELKMIEESNYEALGINALPNEMILKFFGYVEQNQLGQIARVCNRWNMLTRSAVLWKKVDVKFHCSHKSPNTMTRCFINMLPSCVTSIRLDYSNLDWTEELNFEELCIRLQRRCPHLEMLILEHVNFSDNFPSVIGLCHQFLPDVKILVFRHSTFSDCPTREKFGGLSKIEVLDVSDCNVGPFQELQFSNMPQLRVLNLGNSWFGPPAFRSLQNHGLNLEELYLCGTIFSEDDLIFSNSMFLRLKIICLCCYFYIFNSVVSAIQSCQSLQKIYIGERYPRINVLSHPFFENNRGKFKIIETIAKYHSHNVDYSYKRNKI